LQRPRVVPPVCKRVPARMTQHVGVRLDRPARYVARRRLRTWTIGTSTSFTNGSILHEYLATHAREASGGGWGAALRCEHEGRLRFLIALEPPEGAQLVTDDRMRAGGALLGPADVQAGRSEVNLLLGQPVRTLAGRACKPRGPWSRPGGCSGCPECFLACRVEVEADPSLPNVDDKIEVRCEAAGRLCYSHHQLAPE
jgi:hypothetical protein